MVTKANEDAARVHGVLLAHTKNGEVAAISCWDGAVIRRGNVVWVSKELNVQNIPVVRHVFLHGSR